MNISFASEQDLVAGRKALADILQTRSDGTANVLLFEQRTNGTRLLLTLSQAGLTDLASKAVEQSISIGPSLGVDSIRSGLLSIAAGFVFVVCFILAVRNLCRLIGSPPPQSLFPKVSASTRRSRVRSAHRSPCSWPSRRWLFFAIATMFLDLTKTVGFFALTGFEFNLTSIAGDPHHHGLLDQRQDRGLRSRAREPYPFQKDAFGRPPPPAHRRLHTAARPVRWAADLDAFAQGVPDHNTELHLMYEIVGYLALAIACLTCLVILASAFDDG